MYNYIVIYYIIINICLYIKKNEVARKGFINLSELCKCFDALATLYGVKCYVT